MSSAERLAKLAQMDPKPQKVQYVQAGFKRNQLVVAEVLARANGICQQCKKPAPFRKAHNNELYLEVHHKTRLADHGDDTIDNAIALCPNCHREAHYG